MTSDRRHIPIHKPIKECLYRISFLESPLLLSTFLPPSLFLRKSINLAICFSISLIEKCKLDAVISMPSGVFKPYAGVSTAVLFFTKTEHEPTEKVWFYKMENDGFSLDDKRTEIDKNDIPEILERFKNRFKEDNEDRSKKHFFVPLQEIKDNDWDLSVNKYREEQEEEVNHRESKILIKEAKEEVKALAKGFEELEKLVKD